MWLSTVQSFKTLRSVRKSFESKRKESKRRKEIVKKDMNKEKKGQRGETPTKPRSYQNPSYSNPKNQ